MKRIFIVLLLFIASLAVPAQDKRSNNITKSRPYLIKKIDTLFVKAKSAISNHDVKKAEEYLDICLKIATENDLKDKRILCQYYYGDLYSDLKEYQQAASYYNTGLSIAVKDNDYEQKVKFSEKLAATFINMKDYNLAIRFYESLIDLYTEKNNQYGLANTYSNLGSLYFTIKNTEKAQECMANASAIFNKIKNYKPPKKQDNSSSNEGYEKDSPDERVDDLIIDNSSVYFQKNKKYRDQNRTNPAAASLIKIGNVYKEMGDFSKARIHYQKSLVILKKGKNYHEMADAIISLGDISFTNKQYQESKKYYLNSLDIALKYDLKISQMESFKGLSYVLSNQKNYKSAYDYYQKYIAERDLIYDEEKEVEMQKLKVKMDLEKQDVEILLLKKDQELAQLTIDKERVWLTSLIVGSILLLVFILLLYNRYLLNQKFNKILGARNSDLEKMIYELKESETQLVELNNTKDQFFSIISHDLKGPINSMKGYLSLVKSFPDNFTASDIKDFAARMDVSVKNLSQLLNNLLEWAMVQTGAIKVQVERFDINEVIFKKIELFTPQITSKGIKINFTKNRNAFALADQNMIEFVIRNLLHNAVKFTKNEGVIEIEVIAREKTISIGIKDSGIGIDKEALDKLFDANLRHIQEGTNKERGSGLGLILCKDFITRNKGNIYVESTLGKGSSFTVELPSG